VTNFWKFGNPLLQQKGTHFQENGAFMNIKRAHTALKAIGVPKTSEIR
jgi:hypothetical protein